MCVPVCACVCMLKSTKKYYLNDNLLLLVCLLSNVILCTAMGAVMHKPFETKAPVACSLSCSHSLALSHSYSCMSVCIMCVKHISVSVSVRPSHKGARSQISKPKTKPLSRPIWAKDCEASSRASSSRWYLNYLEQVAPKTIQFGRISRCCWCCSAQSWPVYLKSIAHFAQLWTNAMQLNATKFAIELNRA